MVGRGMAWALANPAIETTHMHSKQPTNVLAISTALIVSPSTYWYSYIEGFRLVYPIIAKSTILHHPSSKILTIIIVAFERIGN